MTKALDTILVAVRRLPSDEQDAVAAAIEALLGEDRAPIDLTPEDDAALALSEAQADRGEFASDDDVRSAWAKYGL